MCSISKPDQLNVGEMYIYSLLKNSWDSELFRTQQMLQKTFFCMETVCSAKTCPAKW